MNISQVGLNLIKSFEGCKLKAYKVLQSEQYYTIGWGHYGSDVYEGMTITQEYADSLLLTDLQRYVAAVNNANLSFTPTQNQFDALVSFCYNLGTGIMSDFVGLTPEKISQEIPLYNKSGGQVVAGLVRRRKAEKELFDKDLITTEKIIKEYSESGTFYPTDKIYFRNAPLVDSSNPIVDSYIPGEYVFYDKVVWTDKYIYISWLSQSTGIRRYMPIREVKNGTPQDMWGYIE